MSIEVGVKNGLRTLALLVLIPVPLIAQEPPPQLVQLYRERIVPGAEAAYSKVEEDAARICARLKCPHPYLALEPVTGAKEVWWLNAFASEADRNRVVQAYEQDTAVRDALRDIAQRKKGLTADSANFVASRRSDLCDGSSWRMTGARFFVMTVSKVDRKGAGCVFQASDGTRFAIAPVASRSEADRLAAVAGADAKIYAVRPSWSLPADAWISADPQFWKTSPAAPEQPKEVSFPTKDGGIVYADEYGRWVREIQRFRSAP